MTTKRQIPDRWLPASKIGKSVTGTPFLPFKVPLNEMVCKKLEPSGRFTPSMLMKMAPNLKLIVDLTNTDRYYDKNEFVNSGIQHTKILCPGREIPSNNLLQRFFDVVDKFMSYAEFQDKCIGVHCTHGINRTGYFICKYMIMKLGYSADEAIAAFEDARGHKIEREYFIDELHNRPLSENSKKELRKSSQWHQHSTKNHKKSTPSLPKVRSRHHSAENSSHSHQRSRRHEFRKTTTPNKNQKEYEYQSPLSYDSNSYDEHSAVRSSYNARYRRSFKWT